MDKELYTLLGISEDASQEEIKAAYRDKAKLLHSDITKEDDSAFIKLKKAYETLSDEETRARYNEMGIGKEDFNLVISTACRVFNGITLESFETNIMNQIDTIIIVENKKLIDQIGFYYLTIDKIREKEEIITRSPSFDFLKKQFEEDKKGLNLQIDQLNHQIGIFNHAKNLLHGYSFSKDNPPTFIDPITGRTPDKTFNIWTLLDEGADSE